MPPCNAATSSKSFFLVLLLVFEGVEVRPQHTNDFGGLLRLDLVRATKLLLRLDDSRCGSTQRHASTTWAAACLMVLLQTLAE